LDYSIKSLKEFLTTALKAQTVPMERIRLTTPLSTHEMFRWNINEKPVLSSLHCQYCKIKPLNDRLLFRRIMIYKTTLTWNSMFIYNSKETRK
jgi:hypothetical protein